MKGNRVENFTLIDLYQTSSKNEEESFKKNLESSLHVKTDYEKVIKDTEWIKIIEDTIPYLDNIFRAPNRFIINEEEVEYKAIVQYSDGNNYATGQIMAGSKEATYKITGKRAYWATAIDLQNYDPTFDLEEGFDPIDIENIIEDLIKNRKLTPYGIGIDKEEKMISADVSDNCVIFAVPKDVYNSEERFLITFSLELESIILFASSKFSEVIFHSPSFSTLVALYPIA